MTIVLLDHLLRDRMQHSVWQACFEASIPGMVATNDLVPAKYLPHHVDVLLFHPRGTEDKWCDWHRRVSNDTKVVVISTALRRRFDGHNNWFGCYWHPDEFKTVPQAQEFLSRLKEGKFVPELLWPQGAPTDVLAYLLAYHYKLYDSNPSCLNALRTAAQKEFTDIGQKESASADDMKAWFAQQEF